MGWSGGIFSRVFGSWASDKATTPEISSSRHDVNDDDLEAGINACLPADGSKAMSGDLDMNSNKITGLAAGTASGDAVRFDEISGLLALSGGTMTGDITFSDGAKSVKIFPERTTVTPAGTDSAGATQIAKSFNAILTGAENAGVKLPDLATWGAKLLVIVNLSVSNKRIYPYGSQTISPMDVGKTIGTYSLGAYAYLFIPDLTGMTWLNVTLN